MTSSGRTAVYSRDIETGQPDSDDSGDQGELRRSSDSSVPDQRVPATTETRSPTRRSDTDDRASGGSSPRNWLDVSDELLRCERHGQRSAELYCWTCRVPICLRCGATRHLRTSGHDCWDVDDCVERCRSILRQHATAVAEQHANCLSRIAATDDMIQSICSETEEQEMQMRRHVEELRIRLEQELHRLVQDLETNKNSRIKELAKISSDLQMAAVRLEGRSQELNEMSVHGTAVDVVQECGRKMAATRVDPLSTIPEPLDHVQLTFTKSALLQQANNLVGHLTAKDKTRRADSANRRTAGEWMCANCTYKNQDTDIECQICEHAPWKQDIKGQLVSVTQNQASVEGFSQNGDQAGSTWTCNACTIVNKSTDDKCSVCETPQPVNEGRRSPNNRDWELITEHPPPYVPIQARRHSRSWSDITIFGTVDQATQTEGLDAGNTGNAAQKVIGHIGRIYKLVRNRGPGDSSRDTSPQPRTSNGTLTPEDSASARWPCSQCTCMNSMDRTQCERCGYEEATPAAIIPSNQLSPPQ